MKGSIFFTIIVVVIFSKQSYSQKIIPNHLQKPLAYIKFIDGFVLKSDSVTLRIVSIPNENYPVTKDTVIKRSKSNLQWDLPAKTLLSLSTFDIQPANGYFSWLLEPGDSIIVSFRNQRLFFEGRGSAKLELGNKLYSAFKELKKPLNNTSLITNSIEDYFEFYEFLKRKLFLIDSIGKEYSTRISDEVFKYIKAFIIYNQIESEREHKFISLIFLNKRDTLAHISSKNLVSIYDSSFFDNSSVWLRKQNYQFSAFYDFSRLQIRRKYKFSEGYNEKDHLAEIVEYGKKLNKGWVRDMFLYKTLTALIIKLYDAHKTSDPKMNLLFKKYSNELKNEGYKQLLYQYVQSKTLNYSGAPAPGLALNNLLGHHYNINNDIPGKTVLLNFWNKDDGETGKYRTLTADVLNKFKGDTNIKVFNVFAETRQNKWKSILKSAKITTSTNEYIISNDAVLRTYGLNKYPKIFLINRKGMIEANSDAHINKDQLLDLIKKDLNGNAAMKQDGPYIFANNTSNISYTFSDDVLSSAENVKFVTVRTDEYSKTFTVALQKNYPFQPFTYAAASSIFSLSDIEGNFDSFRKLLQTNKIIDSNYNWIFGKGHLVFAGDMFDRGEQVTECLWLIYSLEEKAKAAGGYVHFILGNHEIMNLQGDHRYVAEKYKKNAALMGKTLTQLYGEDSELGRWLRSKNIIEKVGDVLFMHAGVSREVNQSSLTIDQINQLARLHYDDTAKKYTDPALATVMSSTVGPFWYRGYYKGKEQETIIDSTLQKFGVKHIVTGHTIVANTITTHYDNKVINTDTPHAKGYSEALLVEGRKYYRVNDKGERWLLFEDKK